MSVLGYKLRSSLRSGLDLVASLTGAMALVIVATPVFFKVPAELMSKALGTAEVLFFIFLLEHLLRIAQDKVANVDQVQRFISFTALYVTFFFVIAFDLPSREYQFYLNHAALIFLAFKGAKTVLGLLVSFDQRFTKILHTELSASQLFVISFFSTIMIGTLLLLTPKASLNGLYFVDALFTAVSATCVTGLTVVSTEHELTLLGKTIVMVLFQIGGLGTMTFAMAVSGLVGEGLSFRNKILLSDFLHSNDLSNTRSVLLKILQLTFSIEAVGALILFFAVPRQEAETIMDQIYGSVFHAVSAFCNAGFSVYDSSLSSEQFLGSPFSIVTISFLILLGGLGFPVLGSLKSLFKSNQKLNLHAKVVYLYTGVFFTVGAVLFYLLEKDYVLANSSAYGQGLHSVFASVTARTAGFNTFDTSLISTPTVLLFSGLMFIGAAPMSTAGGLKLTTFAVAFSHLSSRVRKIKKPVMFERQLSDEIISKALNMISLSLAAIFMAIFLLSILERDLRFVEIFFEAFSALGTVGLSMGITSKLSVGSKLILCFLMFVGRVNILVFLDALVRDSKRQRTGYIKEDVIL